MRQGELRLRRIALRDWSQGKLIRFIHLLEREVMILQGQKAERKHDEDRRRIDG